MAWEATVLAVCLFISGCGPSAIPVWAGLGPGKELHADVACPPEVQSFREGGIAEVERERPQGHKSPAGQGRCAWQRMSQKCAPHLPALIPIRRGLPKLGMLPARKPVGHRL